MINFLVVIIIIGNSSLNKTLTGQVTGRISSKKSSQFLDVSLYTIDQFVYYDSNGMVQQFDNVLQHARVNAVFQLRLGSSWYFKNRVTYQWASSEVLALPTFSVKTRLYKEGFLLIKICGLELVVDVQYFTPYTGTTYNPIVRQMTLSNTEIGGFPIVDVFINSEVRVNGACTCQRTISLKDIFINDSFYGRQLPLN